MIQLCLNWTAFKNAIAAGITCCEYNLLRKCGLLAHTSAAFLKNCCTEKLFICLWLAFYSVSYSRFSIIYDECFRFCNCFGERGYCFGVSRTFRITNNRRASFCSSEYKNVSSSSPPSRFTCSMASSTVSFGPFNAKNIPPTFTNGKQYSHSSGIAATALAHATSNCSRKSGCFPPNSALACTQCTGICNAWQTDSRKCTRFCRLSSIVSRKSGRKIRMGMPGKPAPVPTSIIAAPFGISTY